MKPQLILVNGIPGTGKTTLAARLCNDLEISLMGKDMLKEFLMDTLGSADRNESRILGKIASEMQYVLIENYLAAGRSLIAESAFFTEFAQPSLERIVRQYPADVLEIYCHTDAEVNRQRFLDRTSSGKRHPGHFDGAFLERLEEYSKLMEVYAPLKVGKVITVDTTHFGGREYTALLNDITTYLKHPSKGAKV